MAARRLLIILVLLLVVSIVAAALAPDRTSRFPPSTSSTTTPAPVAAPEPTGEELSRRIDASPEKPETVEAFAGDQLALSVGIRSGPGRTITIEPLGLSEFAAPEAPAHFDLLLRDPGILPITDEQGDVVGRVRVKAPPAAGEEAPPGDGSGARGDRRRDGSRQRPRAADTQNA